MSLTVDLDERAILVTGAAGGLGQAVCAAVLSAGGTVVATDLRETDLVAVAERLGVAGRLHVLAGNLLESSDSVVEGAADVVGTLWGLVNCAGIMQTKPLAELTTDDWDRMISLNLNATFRVTHAVAAHLVRNGGGSIVTFSSVSGRSGRPNAAHYAASKAALISLTQSVALAYGPTVRANAVCPGVVLTPMWEGIIADRDREFGPGAGDAYLDSVVAGSALKRVGTPEDVAGVVAFLLSDLSSYVTGQSINVDGGMEMN